MAVPALQRVSRRTVADEARDRLLEAIVAGRFPAGSAMPAERVLCVELGVARTSVRESLRSLHALGYIVRHGNRSYVAEHLPLATPIDGRKTAVHEIFEARRLIEVGVVRMAALRASKRQRASLVKLAERFAEVGSIEEFRELDRQFHWTIATACENATVADLYARVLDALFTAEEFDSLLSDERNSGEVTEIINTSGQAHQAIACAIAAADPDRAGDAASAHLDEVERRMTEHLV